MALARATFIALERANVLTVVGKSRLRKEIPEIGGAYRGFASTRFGGILPEPKTPPFGFVGVICGVVIGLFIGATISKNVANFLEENDLFVPSDDDDDDD